MAINLDVVTHYYLADKKPFLSLSELGGNVDDPVFQEMLHRHQNDPQYNRRYGIMTFFNPICLRYRRMDE